MFFLLIFQFWRSDFLKYFWSVFFSQ